MGATSCSSLPTECLWCLCVWVCVHMHTVHVHVVVRVGEDDNSQTENALRSIGKLWLICWKLYCIKKMSKPETSKHVYKRPCISFLPLTNYPKLDGLKQQKFIFWQFWKSEVQNQGIGRAVFPPKMWFLTIFHCIFIVIITENILVGRYKNAIFTSHLATGQQRCLPLG